MHHDDAIRKLENFVQFKTYQQDCTTIVSFIIDFFMNVFNCANVNAAGRVGRNQQIGFACDFTGNDDFLLIAA